MTYPFAVNSMYTWLGKPSRTYSCAADDLLVYSELIVNMVSMVIKDAQLQQRTDSHAMDDLPMYTEFNSKMVSKAIKDIQPSNG